MTTNKEKTMGTTDAYSNDSNPERSSSDRLTGQPSNVGHGTSRPFFAQVIVDGVPHGTDTGTTTQTAEAVALTLCKEYAEDRQPSASRFEIVVQIGAGR